MKHMRIRDYGISAKFILSLMVFLLLPLTALFVVFNLKFSSRVEQQTSMTVLETLKQSQTSFSYMFGDLEFVSKEALANDSVQMYLQKCKEQPSEALYEYRYKVDRFLESLLDSRKYIQYLGLFTTDGKLLTQAGQYLQVDTLDEYITPAELQKLPLVWGQTTNNQEYVSKSARGYEVPAFRAINNLEKYSDMLGAEKLAVSEKYICSLYQSLVSDTTLDIFLIDRNGTIVSSLRKEIIGNSVIDESFYKQLLQQKEGYLLERENLTTWCTLKNGDWYAVRIDEKSGMVNLGLHRGIFVACIFFITLFGIAFFLIQRKTIIKPIMELSSEVSQFHDGDYQFTQMDRNDEIGVLNRSFITMGTYSQDLIERVYKTQLSEKEAELKCLQAQINPHFLNNTLETIRWMAFRNKQPEIAAQATALARLFKHALNGGQALTTVSEEVTYLRDYVTIQKNRFGDRIDFQFEIDDTVLDCVVMNLILQPLVENAIVHGLEEKLEHGVICIRVFADASDLCYVVEDNGLGTEAAPIIHALRTNQTSTNVLALTNIQQRLHYRYGMAYGIEFESAPGKGTKVTIRMPQQRREQINETSDRG